MSEFQKTEKARVGRENQLYSDKTGARLVAGCVVLNESKEQVLMVQSTAHKSRWVLPKGGIEKDEVDFESAARRETWEEAGVTGDIVRYLGTVDDMRPPKKWGYNQEGVEKIWPPRSEFHFYEMHNVKMEDTYPEAKERKRAWFGYREAKDALDVAKRPELVEALERSSIKKS